MSLNIQSSWTKLAGSAHLERCWVHFVVLVKVAEQECALCPRDLLWLRRKCLINLCRRWVGSSELNLVNEIDKSVVYLHVVVEEV